MSKKYLFTIFQKNTDRFLNFFGINYELMVKVFRNPKKTSALFKDPFVDEDAKYREVNQRYALPPIFVERDVPKKLWNFEVNTRTNV